MILGKKIIPRDNRKGGRPYKIFGIIECDQCNIIFEVSCGKLNSFRKRNTKFNFCSKSCKREAQKKGGVLDLLNRKKCLELYGAEYPYQSKIIFESMINGFIQKYGFDNPSKSPEIKEKIKQKHIELCGYNNIFMSPEFKEKNKNYWIENFGVEHNMQLKFVRKKAHQTKKENGFYKNVSSEAENNFYDFLCELYEKNNIERQVEVNGWAIDFKIKSKEIYIQFDGEFYHGLDRPLEIIKEFRTETDKTIYQTYLRDQKQNKWFKENNLNLVRVTDKEFEQIQKGELNWEF